MIVRISAAYQVGWRSKVSNKAGENSRVVCGVFWGLNIAIELEKNKKQDINAADD